MLCLVKHCFDRQREETDDGPRTGQRGSRTTLLSVVDRPSHEHRARACDDGVLQLPNRTTFFQCIGYGKGTITDLPIKYAFSLLSLTRDRRQIEPMVKRTSWEYRCPSSSASSDANDQPGELVQHQSSTAYHVCRQQRCFYTHNVYLTDMHFHMKAIVHQSGSQDDRSRSENGTRPTQQHLKRQKACHI